MSNPNPQPSEERPVTPRETGDGAEPAPSTARPPQPLTADAFDILRRARPKDTYDVPGVGAVEIWGLNGAEANEWRQRSQQETDEGMQDCVTIQMCLHNSAGARIFAEDDVFKIYQWPLFVRLEVARRCNTVNGWSPLGHERIRKNFAASLTRPS